LNKITGDITKMAAQVPALFETLSGMSMTDLLSKVRLIGDKSVGDKPAKPDALPPAPSPAK
jgi:flotillin